MDSCNNQPVLNISSHTRIMTTVQENIIPIILRWPGPNPLCDILCSGKIRSTGPTFPNMSNIELGNLALKQAINLPYLPSTIRSEMISVIRFSNENTKLLLEIESQYSWLLSSIDDAFENANDLEGIVDALAFVRLNNQKNEVIHSSIDNAIKIIEDGASSIYNPNSSYYVQNARIASLPMFNESGCSTEVPDVLYKGFFSGLKDFGKDLLKSAVKLAKADVKGAVTGGLGGAAAGAAAAGVGAGPGAATGAVAGGVGASTGQAVSDVVDSVGGSDKK